jgi:hypothetical protein
MKKVGAPGGSDGSKCLTLFPRAPMLVRLVPHTCNDLDGVIGAINISAMPDFHQQSDLSSFAMKAITRPNASRSECLQCPC